MNENVQNNNMIIEERSFERTDQWGKRNSAGVVIASSMCFNNVSHKVNGKTILDNISLEVDAGKVLCLLGPSGSGKTTLLKIAAGLVENTSGDVVIDGRNVSGDKTFVPPDKRGVGLMFQDYALFPHLTILQNVEFGLTALSKKDAKHQALRMLSRVGLEDYALRYPHVLSGGEQQRVALARALAPRPGILLMDEPFSGLDSRLRDSIREQTIDLLRETRSTAVIVTHDAEEALRVGDHIALMRDGALVQEGNGHELYYSPSNLFTAGFFSEINVIPATLKDGEALTAFGVCSAKDMTLSDCCAAIRLTDINVKPYENLDKGQVGRVAARRFVGTSELLEINVEGLDKPFSVRIKAGDLPNSADLVSITVDPELMMIFPAP